MATSEKRGHTEEATTRGGSKVKSQPTGEIIDTKPVLNGVTEPTKPCIAWANPILVLCGASLAW